VLYNTPVLGVFVTMLQTGYFRFMYPTHLVPYIYRMHTIYAARRPITTPTGSYPPVLPCLRTIQLDSQGYKLVVWIYRGGCAVGRQTGRGYCSKPCTMSALANEGRTRGVGVVGQRGGPGGGLGGDVGGFR
jgi:hypothetical protein